MCMYVVDTPHADSFVGFTRSLSACAVSVTPTTCRASEKSVYRGSKTIAIPTLIAGRVLEPLTLHKVKSQTIESGRTNK